MILVTHFNGNEFFLNAELIQAVEATPDTLITLTNETKYLVREPAVEVVRRIIEYRRTIHTPQFTGSSGE